MSNALNRVSNNNNKESQFKVRLRNENHFNRNNNMKKTNENKRNNRTPSPPKVLMSTHKFYRQLATRPVMTASTTKTAYTWTTSHSNNNNNNTRLETPDCERKLKRLQQSGLLSKFTNFQITKSIPLALEGDDFQLDEHQNDEFDDMTDENQSVIEVKSSSEEFEPQFVKKIKAEVAKLSSQSFGSQASQRCSNGSRNDSVVRKSLNASKSQSNISVSKSQPKSVSDLNQNKLYKSKSINSLADDKKSDKEYNISQNKLLNRHKSDENADKKRSHSSNGRLSSSGTQHQKNDRSREPKSDKSDIHRSQSQPNVEQIQNNIKVNNNNNSCDQTLSRDRMIRKIKVNNKYYQILNCIGQGGSSKVYQVYDPELQMTLAIKVVDLSKADEQTVSGYKNEITLLCQLRRCKRVVRMYDYEYQNNGQQLLVVMEKGDSDLSNVLKSFIDSDERSLDPHLIRFYWQEMVKVVHEIHQYGVVHSDLKPVNFILVAGKLKIIDFGIANAIKANYTSVYKETQIGTINYMAPEALQNRSEVKGKTVIKFNCKADIWSLGCILYNLVYGRTPFHDYNNLFQKANAILDPKCEINYPPIDDGLLFDCMQKCLQRDPNKRPTTGELLNHSYLTDSIQSSKGMPKPVNGSQTTLMSQINNLTPNRMKQLSQVLQKLSKH